MDVRYISSRKDLVGEQIRSFTREVHGENFEALAKEFAAANNGEIVITVVPEPVVVPVVGPIVVEPKVEAEPKKRIGRPPKITI